VPRTERADLVSTGDTFLCLIDRTRRHDPVGRVREVARPVLQWRASATTPATFPPEPAVELIACDGRSVRSSLDPAFRNDA
jgi:hypothetical protein